MSIACYFPPCSSLDYPSAAVCSLVNSSAWSLLRLYFILGVALRSSAKLVPEGASLAHGLACEARRWKSVTTARDAGLAQIATWLPAYQTKNALSTTRLNEKKITVNKTREANISRT